MVNQRADDPGWLLRHEHRGVLEVAQSQGEWSAPVRFIIDGGRGALVLPLTALLQDAESVVLLVPDESDRSLQVHVSGVTIREWRSSEACDRWLAYHGRGDGGNWYMLEPVGYRIGKRVLDPEEVNLVNGLRTVEARLCKLVNGSRARLGEIAARETGDVATGALCVGVDGWGIDVRVALGILRLDFAAEVESEAGAVEAIERLMRD